MTSDIGLIVSVMIAAIGSVGGFAALMKVNADNSKTVSEGATNVVKLLRDQVADLDARMYAVELYAQQMEVWSGEVTDLLTKAIDQLPQPKQDPFRNQAEALSRARPRRKATQPQPPQKDNE